MTDDLPDFSSAKEFISEKVLIDEITTHGSIELFSIVSTVIRFEKNKSAEHVFLLSTQAVAQILKHPYIITTVTKFGEGTQIWNFDADVILEVIKKNWDTYKKHFADSNIEIAFIHEKFKDNFIKSQTNPVMIITDPVLIYS